MTARALEPLRDRPATSLAVILEGLWRGAADVLSVVFVDAEGECVEYCTGVDPYDAQVSAATWLDATMKMRAAVERCAAGELRQWILESERSAVVVRRVTEEHVLVVELASAGLHVRFFALLDRVVAELRVDTGFDASTWQRWDGIADPWRPGRE